MSSNPKLSYAIAAILSGSTLGSAHAAPTPGSSDVEAIQEITVTAQRRIESIQDVPITIQAISGEQLKQLSIATFDDVVRFLPNVSFATNGPGQGNIFMRGLSPGSAGNQAQSSIASFPNVAIYIDDQSVQFPGRNLDINAVDMERIEVLEGPQGTLFGGGAQAGAVRYITNKPKLNLTEGSADATYSATAGGDPNSSVNAVLNIPLITDHLALRGVIYSDRRGGYIDNVPSNFTRANTDNGTFRFGLEPATPGGLCPNGLAPGPAAKGLPNGVCVPLGLPVTNNSTVVKDNQNPVDYTGIRVSGLYQFDDDWSLLLGQAYQNMEADGVFTQYPRGSDGQTLQALQVTTFTPSWDKDKFTNTSWTLNGKLGALSAIYTGAYLIRTTEQQNDYTNYARGSYGDYYQCTGAPGTVVNTGPLRCYTAATGWNDWTRNTHQTHEMRISTPVDWRLRGLFGAFYEDFKIQDDMNFNYKSIPSCTPENLAAARATPAGPGCVGDVGTAAGSTATHPGIRGDTTAFGEDLQRGYQQTAFFVSADFDIIPKVLTITGGTRFYHYREFETGSEYYTSAACADVPNGCPAGKNLDEIGLKKTYNGFRSRGNLTWHIAPDVLLYYTYSQGYRPGGFNRESGTSGKAIGPDGIAQILKPSGYAPDTLTNHEIGVKSELLDHRLQVNLSAYHMLWSKVQVPLFNPNALGNTTFVTNGANYRTNGVELQVVARVTQALTVQGSTSYNDAKQVNNPCLIANNPSSGTFGRCITEVVNPAGVLAPLVSVYGPQGGTPAFSPKLQYNLRARYDWASNDYKPYVMAGVNHVGGMYNQIDNGTTNYVGNPFTTLLRYYQPGYTTYDASLGIAKDNWTAEAFGTNLSNSNASVFTSSAQFIKSEVPLRPRVVGVKFGYKF
ncbi:MAG: TonB-dependent receptor [Pseudomonadota bacterium]|nr:TonB-dependent receptor [Pseudomonadota bacterium]